LFVVPDPGAGYRLAVDVSRSSMLEILAFVEVERARGATTIELDVLDPDRGPGLFAGETVDLGGTRYIHRPLSTWLDFAERLGLRLATPRILDEVRVRLRFAVLDRSTLVKGGEAGTEKYGTETDFARIHKDEEPGFIIDMHDALERVVAALAPSSVGRVLYLGCNTGDEIALTLALSPALREATHVGVDHSASAIAAACTRFAGSRNVAFHEADLRSLDPSLGRFDLVVSIGTFQSAGLDDRELLRVVVQDHLAPSGALILGVPNCRYVDGEVEYGTRMKNFRQPELGLLVKDIAFYRKYLQQHHKQVFVTGKHYVLVTAVPTRAE